MTRQQRIEKIGQLCKVAGCSDKLRAIHFEQFVNLAWHPHPPQTFLAWWCQHPESIEHPPIVAFNCARYYDEFCEVRGFGVTHLGGDGERTHGGPVEAETTNRALSPGRHDPPLPIASTPF